MPGFTSNIINLITDNLRDRYHNGFPVIKELVQNADDAKASRFVFGVHPGFTTCKHPLLKGSGLWCFNNGHFKKTDKKAIRSFAENAKAGEDSTIGKFGLGMKSVFHLCEAFIYLACDGIDTHSEFLNPWDDKEPEHPHMDWDQVWNKQQNDDISYIQQAFADYLDADTSWFLLWIPLRRKAHLQANNGEEYGSIINSFPGDDPEGLDFLKENELAEKLGGLLPLLANLQEIRFVNLDATQESWKPHEFNVCLQAEPRMNLIDNTDIITSAGKIIKVTAQGEQVVPVWGRRIRNTQADSPFDQLKKNERWPKTRYRDEKGKEKIASDKSSAESAILISHQEGTSGRLTLQWAVFLPLEEESHIVSLPIEGSSRHYRIVLHGQFFIDAGRRGIHDFKNLQHKLAVEIDIIDEQTLRSVWNRALAQQICLSLVLPALKEYFSTHQLKDNEVSKLTTALKKAIDHFGYVNFVTAEYSWFRELLPAGGQWCLHKNNDAVQILSLPAPPQDAHKRPWEVLPCLKGLSNTLFVDKDSATLSKDYYQWNESSILAALRNPTAYLFAEAVQLDYFDNFLKLISPQLGAGNVQLALLKFIRKAISHHGQQRLRNNKAKISRVLEHIPAEKRWRFGAIEENSPLNISDDLLKALWQCEGELLPIPAFLDSKDKPAQGKLAKQVAEQWLKSLQSFEPNSTISLIKTILQSLEPKSDHLPLIKSNADWKIISAYDPKLGSDKAVSYQELSNANEKSLLFLFAGMNKHEGIQLLQKCLSNQVILAIRSDDHKLLFDGEQLPKEDENEAILTALIKSKTALIGNIKIRKELLKKCHNINESNTDAKQGLRYLLHANFDQKDNANDSLWIKAHNQSSAWEKLQRKLIGNNHWQVIDSELSDVLPHNTWDTIGIKEIKPDEIIKELKEKQDIALLKAEDFSLDERNEILNKIDDKNLWCRLPWHKTIGRYWVSIEADTYLKTSVELSDTLKNGLNIIEPVSELSGKQKWITKLDEQVAISIALDSGKSSEYNKEILTWLDKVELNAELQEKLKSTKWLLLKNDQALSPNDIIAITGLEDAIQKLAAFADYAYASHKDLHDSITQHSAFDQKIKPLFATKSESVLGTLALLMNEVSAYAIGFLDESDDIRELATTLADCESAPSWGIIKALCDAQTSNDDQKAKFTLDDCKNHLLPNLNRLPEKEALINIFDWLQKKNTQQAQAAYAFYLRQMVVAGYVEELLPQIKLLAKDGKSWKIASELCIDEPGISSSNTLCAKQQKILKNSIKKSELKEVNKNTTKIRSINILDYLERIEGKIKNPQLGLLMAMLGKSVSAKDKLYPFSIDTIINELGWKKPEMGDYWINEYAKNWTSDFAFEEGFDFRFFSTEKCENEISATNLLGDPIRVYLAEDISNIIVKKGHRDRKEPRKDNHKETLMLDLYIRNEEVLRELLNDKLSTIIKKTCSYLWVYLFGQDDCNLERLWSKLSETHQLDIAVTRSVILKHAAFYLKTLGANKEDKLKKALSDVENAEMRLAEAENNNDEDKQVEWLKRAKERQEGLIKTLQNNDAAQHILEKVQSKLREFQYEPDSILFELFQNADDAVLQLTRCESFPDKKIDIVEQCQHFRIIVRDNTVYAMHWGRPINDRCSTEAQERWSGYGKDLEKMLILSASDKPDDKAVTGRFGLGFKSVFLACDAPKIISGDLRVNIVAGFLPEVWKEAENAQSLLCSYTKNPRYSGTLVALPLRQGIQPDELLNRFKQQQTLLCMTSKTLRHINIGEDSFTWSPMLLDSNKKLEFGLLQGKHYLVYRDETEEGFTAVVMRVSARGFELLKDEDKTPSFWVVAPTRETASVGFVISAPFQIDAGRGKLAGSGTHDDQNKALAEQLGKRMGFELAQLHGLDWSELRSKLSLANDVSMVEWWTSLWKQFSDSDTWKKDDPPFHLVKAFVKSLLLSWSEKTGLIPNGLPQEQADLVQADSISHSIPENWHSSNALQHLRGWDAFDKTYPNNKIVAAWVIQIWRKFKPDSRISELGLGNLIDLVENKKCDVELADKLGSFFAIVYKDEKLTDNEKNQLSEIHFLSKQDTYQSSGKLLSAHESDKEEKLRVAFAPDKQVLSDSYQENGKKFFGICRKQMGCADELEQWFINASTEKQEAALRYIAKSDDGQKLADKVRNQRIGKWFDKTSLENLIKTWDDNDKKIIRHRLQSDSDVSLPPIVFLSPPEPPESQASLAQIHEWWEKEGRKYYRNHYLSQLYPRGEIPNLTIHENGDYSRQGWMLLLSIGVFQRLGRIRDFGTKGFIEYLHHKGWWETFCTNPKENGEGWLNMLYEYSESQDYDEEYSYWMTMLPNLFKVALNLNSYVRLFEGIQHRQQENIPNVLNPNLDPLLQGAGFGHISPINRTLRKGFSLVVRELLRTGVIDTKEAYAYAYMAAPRVQRILAQLSDTGWQSYETSQAIYQLLCNSLDEEKATFGGDFDIPLLVLASNKDLLTQIAGIELEEDDEAEGLFE